METQYLRARYYSPATANFLTEDTYLGDITDSLTLNRYAYVKSSPLNYMDPSGHEAINLEGTGEGISTAAWKKLLSDKKYYIRYKKIYYSAKKNLDDLMEKVKECEAVTFCQDFSTGFVLGQESVKDGINTIAQMFWETIANGHTDKEYPTGEKRDEDWDAWEKANDKATFDLAYQTGQAMGMWDYICMIDGLSKMIPTDKITGPSMSVQTPEGVTIEIDGGAGVLEGTTIVSVLPSTPKPQADKDRKGDSDTEYEGQKYRGERRRENDFVNNKGKSTLDKHASKHGYESPDDYLNDARNFLEKDPTSTTQSFVSKAGTYFRYDTNTNEFGIINEYGGISTYFKPEEGMTYWLEQIELYAP